MRAASAAVTIRIYGVVYTILLDRLIKIKQLLKLSAFFGINLKSTARHDYNRSGIGSSCKNLNILLQGIFVNRYKQ